MKRRYVHIGGPKCASTSLQCSFFPEHRQLYHVGNGHAGRNNRYIDDDVTTASEVDFRYKKKFLYDGEKTKKAFETHFLKAEEDEQVKAVGYSSEFMCFTLANEVDTVEKARRIREVFGDNTTIIFVFREQISLLRSFYTEMVKGGYYGDIKHWFEYSYLYQDRNWCFDFCFDRIVELYQGLFGSDNVCAIPLELLKENENEFLTRICTSIGVETRDKSIRELNKAEDRSLVMLEQIRKFNGEFRHEFGSAFYEPFSTSRMGTYLNNELGIAVPRERGIDDFLRRPVTQAADRIVQNIGGPELDLTPPTAIVERLHKIYGPANRKLAELTGFDLEKYGYHMG